MDNEVTKQRLTRIFAPVGNRFVYCVQQPSHKNSYYRKFRVFAIDVSDPNLPVLDDIASDVARVTTLKEKHGCIVGQSLGPADIAESISR